MKWRLCALPAALALALVSGCSDDSSDEAKTFNVDGFIVGQVDNPDGYSQDSCKFYDGTVTSGSPVIIRGSSGDILGKGTLGTNVTSTGPACAFDFKVDGVKSGEPGYTVDVAPYKQLVVTEAELRAPKFGLTTRTAFDVVTSQSKQPIAVKPPS